MNRNQLQQGRLLIRTGFIPDFITSIPTMTPYPQTYINTRTDTDTPTQTDRHRDTHTHNQTRTHAHTRTHTHIQEVNTINAGREPGKLS